MFSQAIKIPNSSGNISRVILLKQQKKENNKNVITSD